MAGGEQAGDHPAGPAPRAAERPHPRVGIDLLDVERLERALARRPSLALRLFTDGERALAADRARPAMHLAARFCAKEAVAKALELDAWDPRDVEVVGGGDGPPRVRLTGAAATRADSLGATVAISLTHTRTLASAVALVSPGDPPPGFAAAASG